MESTGIAKHIQCSQNTAELLIEAGKRHWIEPREELVFAKGIGDVQTYFVTARISSNCNGSTTARSSSDNNYDVSMLEYVLVDGASEARPALGVHQTSMRTPDRNGPITYESSLRNGQSYLRDGNSRHVSVSTNG
jgi:hypothetical protein